MEQYPTGDSALSQNTIGSANVAIGHSALVSNTTGANNVATGINALFNSTGSANVAIGRNAGKNLTTGSNNLDLATDGRPLMETVERQQQALKSQQRQIDQLRKQLKGGRLARRRLRRGVIGPTRPAS